MFVFRLKLRRKVSNRARRCSLCSEEYLCVVDPNMEVTSVSSSTEVRAPPPLTCRPGTGLDHIAGYWNTNSGTVIKTSPYSNTAGRTDVEGAARRDFLNIAARLLNISSPCHGPRVLLLGARRFAYSGQL